MKPAAPRRPVAWTVLLALSAVLSACTPEPSPRMPTAPANPLPPCPGTPNCVRESRRYAAPADVAWTHARAVVAGMRPASVSAHAEERRLEAVFPVFFFRDDLTLLVAPDGEGAVVHLRSASRVGRRDFGVNRRRAARFFRRLDRALRTASPERTP